MAVIQISKIQVRRGYQEDLPTLASGELGWSIDQRRLWIGNGTLSEGAPEIGNTELLTIYSPLGTALGNLAVIQSDIVALQSNVTALTANSTSTYSTISIYDNVSSPTSTSCVLNTSTTNLIDYNIIRGTSTRLGTIKVSTYGSTVVYDDEYSESSDTGVTLSFAVSTGVATLQYISTNTGTTGNLKYNVKSFL